MVTKTEKSFDCIAFKRKVQAEIYEEIKGLTPQQQIAYFRKSVETGPLADFWKRITAKDRPAPQPVRKSK